jgi:1,2-beta-oligoglucan phosphorylase
MADHGVRPSGTPAAVTLFSARPLLSSLDLPEAEITDLFGHDLRQVEREDACLLSFFTRGHRLVVLKAKELRVLRPHGHIIRTGEGLTPDEASLTSTTWMAGVFNSMLTQGHVSINRFLSTTRSYLSLLRAHGQRIFVERPGGYALLDVPSAYEMSPNGCRWIYKHRDGLIAVRSWACLECHQLHLSIDILAGAPCRLLIANHIALHGDDGAEAVPVLFEWDRGGIVIRPAPESGVGRRFPEGYWRIDPGRGTLLDRMGGRRVAVRRWSIAAATLSHDHDRGGLLGGGAGAADRRHERVGHLPQVMGLRPPNRPSRPNPTPGSSAATSQYILQMLVDTPSSSL